MKKFRYFDGTEDVVQLIMKVAIPAAILILTVQYLHDLLTR